MSRGRKPGFDGKKISAIVKCLADSPDGMWIRKIAQITGLHPSTITAYVDGPLRPLVEISTLGESRPILKVVRLKTAVLERLQEGQNLAQILKTFALMESISSL